MNVCQICGKKAALRKYCPDCRIIANRLKVRENNRKHSAAIVKYCEECGIELEVEGNRKFRFCFACRKKRKHDRAEKTKTAYRLIPNIYGDFRDVENWCKRQLSEVDLSAYRK